MSLDFSHQILASIWEEQIISAHHFCYQYLPQSFLWCFSSLWRREERNPILWASACQLCFWTDALFMCLWQRVVSLMCRNEPGELWGCCWRWDMLCLAVQWFVLVAAAVPILLCKMQSHQVGTVKASCFHCFLGCRSCHHFMLMVFTSCYWKTLMSWKKVVQSHFKSFWESKYRSTEP